jgi:NAD(P)H-nitrite reductase large subunit
MIGAVRVVIVGNGVAGIEAALVVRKNDPKAEIAIVSEESDHFFSRTALMYVLAGQMSYRDIEPYERDLYRSQRWVRVRARATGLDAKAQTLTLAGKDPLPYDRLLIACGSRPRPGPWAGADLAGHFVTLQDLAWLEDSLHARPAPGRPPDPLEAAGSVYGRRRPTPRRPRAAVVIGGGLIGAEVVETLLAARGIETHFVIREDWFWPIALDQSEAAWIAAAFASHGAKVHLDHEVESLQAGADGLLRAVKTDRGEISCELCVIAIGVVPNTEWLAGSPIELDHSHGILVQDGLETSAPNVFAAGDCASVRGFDGQHRPEQLWYTARDQGRIAGRRLLGEAASYRRGVWYNSAKLMDVEYTTVGLVNMNQPEERNYTFKETGPVESHVRIVTSKDRVIGFNLLGRRWDHSTLVRWIERGLALDEILPRFHEASFDTEFVPPLALPRSRADFEVR